MVNNDQTSRRLITFHLATPLFKGSYFSDSTGGTIHKLNDQKKDGQAPSRKNEPLVKLEECMVEG